MARSIGTVFRKTLHLVGPALYLAWPLGVPLIATGAMSQTQTIAAAGRSEFDCVIEPQQVVKLASAAVGMIAQLGVDRGDIVRQGQKVGKIEDGVEAATLALARARATNDSPVKSAEARVQFLRLKYERLKQLHAKSVSPLASLQEAEAEVQVAEQQLKEAQLTKEI